jgi:hypothetical protein
MVQTLASRAMFGERPFRVMSFACLLLRGTRRGGTTPEISNESLTVLNESYREDYYNGKDFHHHHDRNRHVESR